MTKVQRTWLVAVLMIGLGVAYSVGTLLAAEHGGSGRAGKEHGGKAQSGVVHEGSHLRHEGSHMDEGKPGFQEGSCGMLTADEVATLEEAEAALKPTRPDLSKKLRRLIRKLGKQHR